MNIDEYRGLMDLDVHQKVIENHEKISGWTYI